MKLESEHLELIPFSLADLDLFHAINTDSFVRKDLWDDQIIELQTSREILSEVDSRFESDGWGLWKIHHKESNNYIGYAGLWHFFEEPQPQLIYAILRQHTGRGFATEAAQTVIEYTFKTLNFEYLLAAVDETNVDSIKVCQRLGFSFREERVIDGKLTQFYKLKAA